MRWRFVDKIESVRPWEDATGTKAVSFEELHLGKPLGRQGVLPESLVIETCVQLVRWLVAESSEFRLSCILSDVDAFSFSGQAAVGDVLAIVACIVHRAQDSVRAECRVSRRGETIAQGFLGFSLLPLAALADPQESKRVWQDLHRTLRPSEWGAIPSIP